ncbi:MAG TPA: phosphate-starvation-inducible PsiE family protein [Povalibacter sp.]|nr:phosphate-starvation-inducible PsiE family protein [Povalibacter sp.]
MNDKPVLHPVMTRLIARFEALIIVVLQLFMMLVIGIAIYELFRLLVHAAEANWFGIGTPTHAPIGDVTDLQHVLQRAFAGILLILLGLELLDTLKSYFDEHRIRLEIILVVAIIAVGRHIILLDFERLEGWTLVGIGTLVIALTGGYFLIRTSMARSSARGSGPS